MKNLLSKISILVLLGMAVFPFFAQAFNMEELADRMERMGRRRTVPLQEEGAAAAEPEEGLRALGKFVAQHSVSLVETALGRQNDPSLPLPPLTVRVLGLQETPNMCGISPGVRVACFLRERDPMPTEAPPLGFRALMLTVKSAGTLVHFCFQCKGMTSEESRLINSGKAGMKLVSAVPSPETPSPDIGAGAPSSHQGLSLARLPPPPHSLLESPLEPEPAEAAASTATSVALVSSAKNPPIHLLDLPQEMLYKIFTQLSRKDFLSFSCVSRKARACALDSGGKTSLVRTDRFNLPPLETLRFISRDHGPGFKVRRIRLVVVSPDDIQWLSRVGALPDLKILNILRVTLKNLSPDPHSADTLEIIENFLRGILPQLEVLFITPRTKNSGRFTRIAACLPLAEKLRALHVSCSEISGSLDERMGLTCALSSVLPSLTRLEELTLHCILSKNGLPFLLEILPLLKRLHTLRLPMNFLDDRDARSLADSLSQLKVLHTLDLSHNFLYDQGAESIARVLPDLNALRTLNLLGNSINVAGRAALREAASRLPHPLTILM